MKGGVRTQKPACISATAPEDLLAATVSITHLSTVTQVYMNHQLSLQVNQDHKYPSLGSSVHE